MKLIILLLFVNFSIAQNSIVAAGNQSETFVEAFPIMQQLDTIVVEEVSLRVPKYEYSTEIKITSKKKVSFLQVLQQL
jgi:hypothetical protein